MNTSVPRCAFLAFLIAMLASCSSNSSGGGPGITGKVTLGGKPVQSGTIKFEAKSGGAKYDGQVLSGQYMISSGGKPISGPQTVRLTVTGGPDPGAGNDPKKMMMKGGGAQPTEYTLDVDVPAGSTEFDLSFPDKS